MADVWDQFPDAPAAPAQKSNDPWDQFPDAPGSAGKGLDAAVRPLAQDQRTLAISQARGDIANREAGQTLVPTAIDTSGTDVAGRSLRTLEPQQTQQPRQLTDQEKSAILSGHLADKLYGQYANEGNTPGTNVQQQYARAKAITGQQRIEQLNPVENFNNEMSRHVLSLYPNMVDLVAPGTASEYKENLQDFMPSNPDSLATKAGGLVGGMTPYLLGPAGVAVGGAAQAGDYRDQVLAHNQAHPDRPISKTEELVGAATIIAANVAMGRVHPGESFLSNPNYVNALQKYAVGAGYGALDMGAMTAVTNAVEGKNPTEGVGESMLMGGAIHGITNAPEFVRDLQAGRVKADQPTDGLAKPSSDVSGGGGNGNIERAAQLAQPSQPAEESHQQAIDRLTTEADAAEARLRSGATLAPEEKTSLEKTVDHNRAVIMDHMMAIEDAQDAAAAAAKPTPEVSQSTSKVGQPKFTNIHSEMAVPPAELKDPADILAFAKDNNYETQRLEGKDSRAMLTDMANQRIDRERGVLPETTPGGKKILPDLPTDHQDMSLAALKRWAKENGYERTDSISDRVRLKTEMAKQRRNSKTDLPELPDSSKNWNPNQARYWAEQNGYKVEEGMSVAEIKNAVREQHKATSTSQPDEVKLAALNTARQNVTQQAKAAQTSIANAPKKAPWYKGTLDFIKDVGLDVGERIRDISEPVFGRLMRTLELDPRQRIAETRKTLVPTLEKIQGEIGPVGSPRDEQFKALWHDQNWAGMKEMLPKTGDTLDSLRPILADLHAREVKAGIRTGSLGEDYLPSNVKDLGGLRALHPNRMSDIEEAWNLKQRSQGKPLTAEEKIEVANNVISGFNPAPGGNRPGYAKARTRGKLTTEELASYDHPFSALMHRVERGERSIGKADFLGKGKSSEPDKLLESVGSLVKQEVESGRLDQNKEQELISLIHTRLAGDLNTPGKGARVVRQAIHLMSLGHITSGVRQLTDLFIFSAPRHGLSNTVGAVGDALRLTAKDKSLYLRTLGLDPVTHDFVDPGKIGKAVDVVTKANFFQKIDVFTKEVEINAFRRKLEGAAKDQGGETFRRIERDWKNVMGEADFHDAVDAARRGDFTNRNLRDLSAMSLSEVQPITMTQMPRKYLEMKDGRLFYTLRTFQLKQLANIRRDIVQRLASPGQRAEGMTRLVGLLGYGLMANFGMRAMEDLINGKDLSNTDIPERSLDAGLNIVGANRFMATTASQGHPLGALIDMALSMPGQQIKQLDAPFADVHSMGNGKGFESIKLVPAPFVSDLLYYWSPWGAGYSKNKDEATKEYREKLTDLKNHATDAYKNGDVDTANELMTFYNDRRKQGPGDGRQHPLAAFDLKHTIDRQLVKERANAAQ